MPDYNMSVAYDARQYQTAGFTAPNDAVAREKAIELANQLPEDAANIVILDVTDVSGGLDVKEGRLAHEDISIDRDGDTTWLSEEERRLIKMVRKVASSNESFKLKHLIMRLEDRPTKEELERAEKAIPDVVNDLDRLEIDGDADISRIDYGYWVSAWFFCYNSEGEEDE